MWFFEVDGRREVVAIESNSWNSSVWTDVMSKCKAHAQLCCSLCAITARTKQPDGRKVYIVRCGFHGAEWMALGKLSASECEQFRQQFGKIICTRRALRAA